MAKFVYLGIIVICIVIISFCGYYFMGGFDPVEVQEVENMSFNIAGKPYKGKYYKADSLRRIQEEIGELIMKDQVNGNYAEVSYVNTGVSEEEVDLFVGTIFFENEIQIPGTFKVREFTARKFLAVKLNMHYAVRPSEQEVQAILYTYGREKGYKLEDYFINITFKNNSLEVYVPLKD